MRFFYNLLTYLLFLPYVGYWLIRGITNRSYLQRIGERLGIGYPRLDRCIWIHAVSVGEVVAAAPLVGVGGGLEIRVHEGLHGPALDVVDDHRGAGRGRQREADGGGRVERVGEVLVDPEGHGHRRIFHGVDGTAVGLEGADDSAAAAEDDDSDDSAAVPEPHGCWTAPRRTKCGDCCRIPAVLRLLLARTRRRRGRLDQERRLQGGAH